MSNYDENILISNIQGLMSKNSVTQQKLADILGMSQSNVSKALSYADKKSFTLDQVVGIAQHFSVSVDYLVGKVKVTQPKTTPRMVGALLAALISNSDAEFVPYKYEEDMYIYAEDDLGRSGVIHKKEPFEYTAVIFPAFTREDVSYYSEDAICDYYDSQRHGNETRMKPLNDFLRRFNQIHEIYKSGGLENDTYETVVNDLLSHLSEE